MAEYDVFLSHNDDDRPAVEVLARRLVDEAGLQPWFAKWHLVPGTTWQEALEEALSHSQTCAVCIGPVGLGAWHQEEMRVALDARVSDPGFRVIPVLLPGADLPERGGLPPFLSRHTWVDFRSGLDEAYAFHNLVCGIKGIAPVEGEAPAPRAVCPYLGLHPFQESHARFFFGRGALTQWLVEDVRQGNFLAIIGPSGSGKSSLARAGLIPALRGGALYSSDLWPIRILTPGTDPIHALASRLLALLKPSDPVAARRSLSEGLRSDPRELARSVEQILAKDALASTGVRFLLLVDQFEEIFTLCQSEADRTAFIAALLDATSPSQRGLIGVVTMRADFYSRAATYHDLAARLERRQRVVSPMDEADLRQAIEEPARLVGLHFEKGLVETILDDIGQGSGVLPLLQHTLWELWQQRRGDWLTFDAYRAINGVQGALAHRAEEIYAAFAPHEQQVTRRVLLRLIQPGETTDDTRRRASKAELVPDPAHAERVEGVVQKLADARLLTTSRDESTSQETVDIAHEALIQGWPRLQGWVNEDRAGLLTHHRLTEAAGEWQANGREGSYLYSGSRLVETEEWASQHGDEMNVLEQEFLTASQAARLAGNVQRRRVARFRLGAIATIVLLIIAILSVATFTFMMDARRTSQLAQQQREAAWTAQALQAVAEAETTRALAAEQAEATRAAEAELARQQEAKQRQIAVSGRLAAQSAVQISRDPALALLLSIEAWRSMDTFEARNALLAGLTFSPRLDTVLHGFRYFGTSVAISPDGEMLAAGGCGALSRGLNIDLCLQGEIRLWSVSSGQALAVLQGHADNEFAFVTSVAFSPDGRMLASGAGDHTVILWDVASQQPLFPPLTGHARDVTSVVFSPDSSVLASASWDGSILIWDVASGQILGSPLTGESDQILSISFSPDGQILASGSSDHSIVLWDVATQQPLPPSLTGPQGLVTTVAFSPDGQVLASGSSDNSIVLWDVATRQPLASPLVGHDGSVNSVAFSPDGQILASGSSDNSIVLWDVESRQRVGPPLIGHTDLVNSLAFSPDGTLLASVAGDQNSFSQDNRVLLWNVAQREPPGGALLPVASVRSLAFSPQDSEILALGTGNGITLWNGSSGGSRRLSPSGSTDQIDSLAFSPDGQTLASGSMGEITLWNLPSGQPYGEPLTGHPERISALAFSPDGQTLASLSPDGTTILWNVTDAQRLHRLSGPLGEIGSIAFRSDGQVLAVGGATGVVLWSVLSGEELAALPLIGEGGFLLGAASISPDFQAFVTVGGIDRTGILQSMIDGQQIGLPLTMHDFSTGAAFSPDGSMLALGEIGEHANDPTVTLWDVATGQRLGSPFTGHSTMILDLVFSPDGQALASRSRDGAVILWDLHPESWVERACRIANRNLTGREWVQFLGELPYRVTCPNLPAPEDTSTP